MTLRGVRLADFRLKHLDGVSYVSAAVSSLTRARLNRYSGRQVGPFPFVTQLFSKLLPIVILETSDCYRHSFL